MITGLENFSPSLRITWKPDLWAGMETWSEKTFDRLGSCRKRRAHLNITSGKLKRVSRLPV